MLTLETTALLVWTTEKIVKVSPPQVYVKLADVGVVVLDNKPCANSTKKYNDTHERPRPMYIFMNNS
jgi:hypothetical protein